MTVPVLMPYVDGMLEMETRAWALRGTTLKTDLTWIMPGDDYAYWRILNAWWRDHVDTGFIVVEHDIVPTPGVVEEMAFCGEPWCASPYPYGGRGQIAHESLGCTKFSPELIRAVPTALMKVSNMDDASIPARHWCRLDVRISRTLKRAGFVPHHHAASRHLHDYSVR